MGTNNPAERLISLVSTRCPFVNRALRSKVNSVLFGDGVGLTVFLGALIFFGLYWRIGVFVTDNYTIANTLVGLTDGHLYIERVVYGPDVFHPGTNIVDGEPYGRNFGHIVLALPVYYLLEGLSLIVDLRIALAGFWSLLLLEFLRRVDSLLGTTLRFEILGIIGALLLFAINVAYAAPLEPRMHHLMALQLVTMIAGALIGVILYRLVRDVHDGRTGGFVSAATILASPIAFWASIPKRHVLTALFAMVAFYAFYVSRSTPSDRTALWARCASYSAVGLWAWIHAPEALAMLAVLVVFDIATARSNSPYRLGAVGVSFLISLIPFFATNWLISGNPIKPPRLLSRGGSAASGGGSATTLPFGLSPVLRPLTTLLDLLSGGLGVVLTEPDRVFYTFIRSSPTTTAATTSDLTILETTPLFAVFLAIPVLWYVGNQSIRHQLSEFADPDRQTDAFGLGIMITMTLLYMNRLPLHAMWTVRYLLVIVPFGMYFVGRLAPIRHVIAERTQLLVYSYVGFVLIGGQLMIVFLVSIDPVLGELIQFHGILGIIGAVVVGGWAILSVVDREGLTGFGAVAIAAALAIGTLFILMTGLEYFKPGSYALAMSEQINEIIPLI